MYSLVRNKYFKQNYLEMRKSEPSEEHAVFELLNYKLKAISKDLCYINDSVNLKLL